MPKPTITEQQTDAAQGILETRLDHWPWDTVEISSALSVIFAARHLLIAQGVCPDATTAEATILQTIRENFACEPYTGGRP